MDYEKKYKEALSLARKMQENSSGTILNKSITITDVFPELAKSEDEEIREEIVRFIQMEVEDEIVGNKWIAWLEKQVDKEKDKRYEYLEELIVADDIYQMSMNEEMIKNAKTKVIDALDKLHLLELLNIEKKNEQKSIDSIEHKFNVDDWLVSIYTNSDLLHIIGVDDKDYEVETPHGNTGVPSIAYVDSHFRRWTINDAKEGDVLVSKNGNPFIYNGNYNSLHIGAYCGITCDDNKFKVAEEKCHWTENAGIEPSIKEKRDILFTKMKEDGYEFDFENKELKKKIELKFNVGDWVVNSYGDVWHIDSFDSKNYQVSNGDKYCYFPIKKQNEMHLWTIQDAKDGDVLVDEDNNIGIYKEIEGICWHSYIYLGCDNRLYGFSIGGSHIKNNTKPATKEQRDLLFQTLKEKGYKWNDEKKKLKKIDQMFKVGDWIVTDKNDRVQIKAVNNDYYTIDNGMYFNVPYVDKYWHLWTIQDARAGDVLAFDDETIVIFKDLYNTTTFHSYCHIEDGIFDTSKDDMPDWWESEGFHPATKEQCDTLMKAMADAGYAFDFEKKELEIADFSKHLKYSPDAPSIIEHKPAWSEEDEKMFCSLSNSLARISSNTRTDSTSVNYTFFTEIDWLKSLKDRVQPQSKEWSEEDENKLSAIIEEGYLKPSERQWLKSLKNRVQPNLKN